MLIALYFIIIFSTYYLTPNYTIYFQHFDICVAGRRVFLLVQLDILTILNFLLDNSIRLSRFWTGSIDEKYSCVCFISTRSQFTRSANLIESALVAFQSATNEP